MTRYKSEYIQPVNIQTITPVFPRPVSNADETTNIHIKETASVNTEKSTNKLALIILLLMAMDML